MKVGIVGAGSMGFAHAPAWKMAAPLGAQLVGVTARHKDTANALAKQHGLQLYDSFESLLADVDIVDICTPTNLHRDMTMQAAEAGKHVLCEKPIALTLDDGRAMIDACKKANVRLFVGLVVRFFPQYIAAQQAIASGQIGKVGVIRLARAGYQPRKSLDNWFTDESRSGGMILDLMIHDYDVARWLGGNVKRVFAKSVRSKQRNAPGDYALVTLRFENGAIGHIEGGWAYPPPFFRTSMDIAGTDGLIEWTSDTSSMVQIHLMNPPKPDAAEVAVPVALDEENPFSAEIGHFYDAVVNNKPFSVTAEDALAALQIALAARESLHTGRSVTINQEAL
jgi:predicted dehydrogenase